VEKSELKRLEAYLRRALRAPKLALKDTGAESADLLNGSDKVGDVTRDEDEGEMSYFVNVALRRAPGAARNAPLDASERVRLQSLLNSTLGASDLSLRARPRKTDSAEVYQGEEFIGTISSDEESRDYGYFLTMSVLDIDLEE
jgi:hypothetical protein